MFVGGEGHGVVMGVSFHVSESSSEEDMMTVVVISMNHYCDLQKLRATASNIDCCIICSSMMKEGRRNEWDRI